MKDGGCAAIRAEIGAIFMLGLGIYRSYQEEVLTDGPHPVRRISFEKHFGGFGGTVIAADRGWRVPIRNRMRKRKS